MPLERVWSRFESRRNDGTVLKLKIQDIPRARIDDAIELMLKYFVKEEPVHKAAGIHEDPEPLARYKQFLVDSLRDPSYSIVVCCADADGVRDIMGVSLMCMTDGTAGILEQIAGTIEKDGTLPLKKMNRIFRECDDAFDPIKEYSLNKFYADRDLLVVPGYRALGIARQLFKVRYNNPNAVEEWLRYENFRDPSSRFFMCCLDGDTVEAMMGVVVLQLKTSSEQISSLETFETEEIRKLATIFQEADSILDGKVKNPSAYCEPGIVVVFPKYRGLGLPHYLTAFVLSFAEAHGVPTAGSWFTAFGTQEADRRAGFQTVCEIQYEDLAKKHSLTFTNAPPSMKYMMLGPTKI